MNDDIMIQDIGYGAFTLEYPGVVFNENMKYSTAEFNKLYFRRLRLPEGKGNIIYLLSKDIYTDINMINNTNFYIPPSYRRIFFPQWYMGSFMGRRVKVNAYSNKKDYDKYVRNKTKLRTNPSKFLQKTMDNLFFCTSDIYNATKNIMDKMPIKRCYTEFFKDFYNIINSMTPGSIVKKDDNNHNNRILIIDSDSFGFNSSARLNDNKSNPLYLIYLAFLRKRDLSFLKVDIDILIFSKNMFFKFNPAKITSKDWTTFRIALFKICKANLDEYTDNLTIEEKQEISDTSESKILSNIIEDTTAPYTKNISSSTKATLNHAIEKKIREHANRIYRTDEEIKKAIDIEDQEEDIFTKSLPKSIIKRNVIKNPLNKKHEKLFKALSDYESLIDDEYEIDEEDEDAIKTDTREILSDDDVKEEVLEEVQDKIIPIKKSNTISERDKKLREQQKKVIVNNSTIEDILEKESNNVNIIEEDKSKVMHTSNQNMHKIKFANFEKTYINQLYVKDLIQAFDMLKDLDRPFYITNIDIKDTSDNLNYKETWTVSLKDELNKTHKVIVDIPKFQDYRFMLINGTRFMILKQNFYNPLVKDTPDTVIITTNYNKITIQRRSTNSLSTIQKIFNLVKKTNDNEMFTPGDSTESNLKFISTLDYDELSKRIFRFHSENCLIYFSREYIKNNQELQKLIPKDLKHNEFYIGQEGRLPIIMNYDLGIDRKGRTISQIIEENLPDKYLDIYNSIKTPNRLMFVEGKLAGQFIPIITVLTMWVGLKNVLDRMKIKWTFYPNIKRLQNQSVSKKYIKFANGILEYESKIFAELILNGISKMSPEDFTFEQFETEDCYIDFIHSIWGNYNGINEINTFFKFLIDPITKQVCKDMLLPDDPVGLLIRAVELLSDNSYKNKAFDGSYRTRSIEIIPAILYSCLAKQYKAYEKSGGRLPMTLNRRAVISALIAEKTVEPYSTLNPTIEVNKAYTISTKGYKGSNSEHSYDKEKRSYDPSAIGKLAIQTSPK